MRTKKEAALEYARRGWRVLPCHSMENGRCSCKRPDCKSPGKHPRTPHGCKDATADPEQVARWWDNSPDANIGIATGSDSGIWVLDLDGPEAFAALAEFEAQHGPLPPTVAAKTSRGEHHYYRWDDARPVRSTKPFAKADTRGEGGYVIAPPSNHQSGTDYRWLRSPADATVAAAPDWLHDLARGGGAGRPAAPRVEDLFDELVGGLDVATAPGVAEGGRHRKALQLIGAALGRGLSLPWTTALALEWAGKCDPPMDREELLRIVEDLVEKDSQKLDDLGVEQPTEWPVRRDGALYGLAGEIVRFIEPETEADPMALLVQLLVFFGTVIGRSAHFLVGKTHHYCNLFAAVVGETAKGRKGTSADVVRALFQDASLLVPSAREVGGLVSGEGLIYHVRDPQPKAESAVRGGGTHQPAESQGVADKRLHVLESEFGSVLNVLKREGNTLSPVLRLVWDSKKLGTLSKNSPLQATDPHVSIVGHITRAELLRSLSDVDGFNGFANRFLWVCARRARLLPTGGADLDLSAFRVRLGACIEFGSAVGRLVRDADAERYWAQLYTILSRDQPGLFGAVVARSDPQVLRVSLLYALLDRSTVVRREHLEAAYALWLYCEDSARVVFGNSVGDRVADKLLAAIREKPRTGRDLHQVMGRHASKNDLRAALQQLVGMGLIRCDKVSTGGRPSEVWRLA